MYRLEIIAGRTGIDADHIIWRRFRLNPCNQTPLTTTYACKLSEDLPEAMKDLLDGWCEEGDILTYVCEKMEDVQA